MLTRGDPDMREASDSEPWRAEQLSRIARRLAEEE
jgi:hypothetical protein